MTTQERRWSAHAAHTSSHDSEHPEPATDYGQENTRLALPANGNPGGRVESRYIDFTKPREANGVGEAVSGLGASSRRMDRKRKVDITGLG